MAKIFRPEFTVEQLRASAQRTLQETLGIEITQIGEDFIRGTMPVDQRTCQPMRILHGGRVGGTGGDFGERRRQCGR